MKLRKNKKQKGIFIMEAVVALLIFMVGILGIIKYQGETIIATTDAQNRITAAFLADSLIGDMWIQQAKINEIASKEGAIYQAWMTQANNYLPGINGGNDPTTTPIITVTNGLDGARSVSITIRWKLPSSDTISQYQLRSTIL